MARGPDAHVSQEHTDDEADDEAQADGTPTDGHRTPRPGRGRRPAPHRLQRERRRRQLHREQGITLFGVGVGSDYGDALMEQLADRGDGHTTYVSTEEEAEEVFCEELPRHVDLTARDAKAQVSFDTATVEEFRTADGMLDERTE